MDPFLAPSEIVDFPQPPVAALAKQLRAAGPAENYAARCFNWVKHEVAHSMDTGSDAVPCRASEVAVSRVGLCYAKSHLLVALLRAGGVPAGFCYQRLGSNEAGSFCLHGLVALRLAPDRWYRIDPRGGERGAHAQFSPPAEKLVYPIAAPGEVDVPGVFAEPLPRVAAALRRHTSLQRLLPELPDWAPPFTSPSAAGTTA